MFWRKSRIKSNKVTDPTCNVCQGKATKFKTLPPWPGSHYSHTSYACDAHESYLHGQSWFSFRDDNGDVVYQESDARSSCVYCGWDYGNCGCPHEAKAQQFLVWESGAEYGDI